MGKITLGGILASGVVVMSIWFFYAIPELTNPPEVFEVSAENIGMIQIADDVGSPLSDPIKMVFVWNANVVERIGNEMKMQTSYTYRDILTDEILWETILDESVDSTTRKYIDKPGHFMFPANLEQKNYQVYDVGGSVMNYNFIGVTEIDGLEVFEFSGETTFEVSDIYPDFDVPIYEDYSATNFIEPETGIEVSFTERFTDYAIIDNQKVPILDAWDGPSEFSQKILIQKAETQKRIHDLYHNVVPAIIAISTLAIAIIVYSKAKVETKSKEIVELKQTETRKDEFSSMIAHELKTPLVPIKSYLDMIISGKIGQLTPQQIEKLEIVRASAESLNKLIDDLSDVQKLDTGNMKMHREINSLSDIINETVIKLEPDFNKKGIKTNLQLNPIGCFCDKSRISQVILNLLTNSIDFTPSSDGEITVSLSKEGNFAKLFVEDNGSGIPEDKLEHIFQKYYQVDSSLRREYGGTGLGLSITKGIVDMHGGTITVESKVGEFTRFTIMLPLNDRESQISQTPNIES